MALSSRGDDGVDRLGERLKPNELEEPIGDIGLGEELRDWMGEREKGPDRKPPEGGSGEGATEMTGEDVLERRRDIVGEDCQAERVFARRLG